MVFPKTLTPDRCDALLGALCSRFERHVHRHPGLDWSAIRARLAGNAGALWSLHEMERTGGAPDVIGQDDQTGRVLFVDCSAESPAGRRSVCYDREARASRKKHAPRDSAMEMAAALGIDLLSEAEYRRLQELEAFDTTTSSWIQTPPSIRALGGALFCDRRYDTVFVYHNGAQSYYAARGFRGVLRV